MPNENTAGDSEPPEGKEGEISYRYWVGARGDGTEAAAPPPQPRKITPEEAAKMHRADSQGSLWNQGGTWEEQGLNDWAKSRLAELLGIIAAVELNGAPYSVSATLESLTGDTTIVLVRNKRRHGYMLDITLKLKGQCGEEGGKALEGTLHIAEATYGDTDSLHLEVTIDAKASGLEEGRSGAVKGQLESLFRPRLQQKLEEFEKELVQR